MTRRFILLLLFSIAFKLDLNAMQVDTLLSKKMDSVTVIAYLHSLQKNFLPEVAGTYIFSGKKSEYISLRNLPADLSNKIGRQVFAKVPGVFVYDMDGAGNQLNIATRGLDPHRGWEFNIRKDGIITNSDMYGYPASHYSMPLESIDHIELVRGTGSLQYGAQFGGMLNYVSKQGDSIKPISVENITTIGSYNLLSNYLAVGGHSGKFTYYAYAQKKSRDGYRKYEHTDAEAESIMLQYDATSKLSVKLEWSRSTYTYRMAGPLTDQQFHTDPTQATRTRNYFNPDIHIPSLSVNWQVDPQTKISFIASAVLGKRNSVLFDKPTNIADTINQSTFQYNNRQVDIDAFDSHTSELRIARHYQTGKQISVVTTGVQYMNNDLHRTQLGVGTTGSDFDLSLVKPGWGRDLHFITKNVALFAENKLSLSNQFAITFGGRIESGVTNLKGIINYYPENKIPLSIEHHFPLFAAGFTYKLNEKMNFYGGWSQSYRPMIFKDLIPGSLYEKVDPEIRDANGYNAEIGFRGNWRFLKWDITGFVLKENNRFGTLAQTDNTGTLVLFRTNIGNSFTKGAEIFIEANWLLSKNTSINLFTATSFLHARYEDAKVKSGNVNVNINGNKVESAPDLTTRNGFTFRHQRIHISILYSFTSETYADALNTYAPSPTTGAVGLVPSYGLVDLSGGYKFSKNLELKVNISNLTNKSYFTKRPMFYPGPGVWPSDGRNFSTSLIFRLS